MALSRAWPRAVASRAAIGTGAAALAALLFWLLWPRGRSVDLRIDRFHVEGAGVPQEIADSLPRLLAARLTGFPDFSVAGPGTPARGGVSVGGTVGEAGPLLRVVLRLPPRAPITLPVPLGEWREAADLLADTLLVRLYSASPLDSLLPIHAMPRTPEGLRTFPAAEKAFAHAWWDSAYAAYTAVETEDSTCVICAWRRALVGNFLSLTVDSADQAVYQGHLSQFPPDYQALIRSERAPLRSRLDSLDALARRWPSFLLGVFRVGDERVHRGEGTRTVKARLYNVSMAIVALPAEACPCTGHHR